uniref:TRAF-type domain-containing protein n=1 Tax=Clytia hemisphaerica TaxID=252671 RepID=A0A7M5USF1_9CNID
QGHHQMRCQYETVPCENKGCLVMELRKNLPNHQRDCEYRLTQCGYCQLTKPVIEMKNHRHECPMMKVVYSNDECNVQVLRKDVGQHLLRDCLYEKIECNYRALGC